MTILVRIGACQRHLYSPKAVAVRRRRHQFLSLMLLVGSAVNALASCTNSRSQCGMSDCGSKLSVSASCEIVSFTTTCVSHVSCQHGECMFDGDLRSEDCSITAKFNDETTATTKASVSINDCCRTVFAKDFVVPPGAKCTPPGAWDADTLSSPETGSFDAPPDVVDE